LAKELLREHLTIKFPWNISLLIFWEDKTFWTGKALCQFRPKSHIYIGLWWPFKIQMRRCDCWQILSKILSGNRLRHWCNRLHSYFSWIVVTLHLKYELPTFKVSSNRLHMMYNRLHTFKALVIDYMCLGWLWDLSFWDKVWS